MEDQFISIESFTLKFLFTIKEKERYLKSSITLRGFGSVEILFEVEFCVVVKDDVVVESGSGLFVKFDFFVLTLGASRGLKSDRFIVILPSKK
jgi:hypothetical protein